MAYIFDKEDAPLANVKISDLKEDVAADHKEIA
jgi:hypothetical protein